MEKIKERLSLLYSLIEEYPIKLPLKVVADFLDMNEEGLKAALMRKNVPFGFAYQKTDGGNRVIIIPTVTFVLWYTNSNAEQVLNNQNTVFESNT